LGRFKLRNIVEILSGKRALLWIVFAWAVLCIGIGLVGFGTLRQTKHQMADEAAANAERVSRLLLANFERTSDSVDGFLKNFATGFTPQSTPSELFERLRSLNLPSAIVQLAVVGPDGRALVSNLTPEPERVDVSDRMHIRVHRENRVDGLYISPPVLGRISNLWTIQFTRAVRDDQGNLQAILVASYDLRDFTSFYGGLNISGQGMVALAGLDGIVRVRSAAEASYAQDLSALPRFRKIVEERNGRFEDLSAIDNVARVGYFTTSERYPFLTMVAFDQVYLDRRLATVRLPIIASLLGLALVLTLAMIGAVWVVRREAAATARLHHTQRLEALGRLTGGIAHDFNNLLTIIMGSLDMLGRAREERRARYIDNAVFAVDRAKALTHQLLAFSRRQTLSPAVTDLNRLIIEIGGMLTHSLRDDITVELDLDPQLWPVNVDADQFHVALINLAVNARDAIPNGGVLRIQSQNLLAAEEVCLTVSDTGTGMTQDIAARVFEPFFTTKEMGKGTGLGLAQVYGFVHQSGGRLKLDTALGKGTGLSLHFPRSREPLVAPVAENEELPSLPAGLRALVVDDNPDISNLAANALEEQGCIVKQAHSATEAMSILRRASCDILLSDIVMPGEMDGISLARLAKAASPDLIVILMTGYSERLEGGEVVEGELLLKPFAPRDLAAALQRALGALASGKQADVKAG
jgi:two-component system NtrC family sensor kinase